jgi:hypothetical protein
MFVRRIFEILYDDNNLIPPFDGLNIKPNEIGPYHTEKIKDWPHLDQTWRGVPFNCIQDHSVLTNTTDCNPGSCHIYDGVLDIEGIDYNDTSNWCKIKRGKRIM